MREYKVTYETVGRGVSFIVAESYDDAVAYTARLGPVISIEMLDMPRHEQGERWSEALRRSRFRGGESLTWNELVGYAAEAQGKPDIAAVEDALDYADLGGES